jgi:hypothetical protein
VANKGGVREEGVVGWLLDMARETGSGPVRRSRGAKDGSARPACPREEDEGSAGSLGRPKAETRWRFGSGGQKGGKERRAAAGPEFKRNSF